MTVLNPARPLTTPQPNPDPITWTAPSPVCGCDVAWSQSYAGEPVPAVCGCETPANSGVSSVVTGRLGGQLKTDEGPPLTGVTSTVDGPSNRSEGIG